jgi:ribonuclease BN (tRNA processing enzyme)
MQKKASAKELVLTHINDTYETEVEIISEARPIYPETKVARDGLEILL